MTGYRRSRRPPSLGDRRSRAGALKKENPGSGIEDRGSAPGSSNGYRAGTAEYSIVNRNPGEVRHPEGTTFSMSCATARTNTNSAYD